MAHRGPDDFGEWWSPDGRVGLGHRRLAILDLTSAGHQPMQDATGRLTIVFNGEIYNFRELHEELQAGGFRFRSRSDTEVILAAYARWGAGCVSRLNGMFAFCIFDAAEGRLFLARDRAGEKPLFYALSGGEFRFSSEIKGILADPAFPRRLDRESCDIYLAMGYVPGERTILRGISKLPPAHALEFDVGSGSHRVWRYWSLPEAPFESAALEDEGHLLEELEELLDDSVRRQLEADVPVGVLLSGGVDSSLVTAMAVRSGKPVKTFTVTFPGFSSHDESQHARLVAEHFGTDHAELTASKVLPDLLPVLAHQYDEPIADSSMLPTYLLSQLVRAHCTVALGGDGGDELFGGYMHYSRLLWTREKLAMLPMFCRRLAARTARHLPTGYRGRNWLRSLERNLDTDLPLIASFFDAWERRDLMGGESSWPNVAEAVWESRLPLTGDLLQKATRMEFENYMPEDILVKVDRACMRHSLEVRAPLLDYRLIEFAFGRVPSGLKATARKRKILLKRLAAKLLPEQFDQQRKQGFSVPLSHWLKEGPWREYFWDILLGAESTFDRRQITELLKGQDRGRNNHERLFALVLLELWRRDYRVTM